MTVLLPARMGTMVRLQPKPVECVILTVRLAGVLLTLIV